MPSYASPEELLESSWRSLAAPVLMHLTPLELPVFSSMEIGAPALAFAAALTLICAFGLQPGSCIRKPQYAAD